MLGTAVAFHLIDLLGERGLSSTEAAANFLPQTVAALLATLAVGVVVVPGWSAIGFGVLIGASGGAIRTLEAGAFPRYFGTTHLGAIRGVVAAVSVGSTAFGPVLFALVQDATGGYGAALAGSAVLPLLVAVAAIISPMPSPLALPLSGRPDADTPIGDPVPPTDPVPTTPGPAGADEAPDGPERGH